MRRIVLNLAMSIDGFIADADGGFEWIKGDGDGARNTGRKFDFAEFVNSVDVIVMGSKAYEDCPKETLQSFSDKKIVVATSRKLGGGENVEFINGDICSRILEMKKDHGKDIWLFGGAGLVDPFMKADIVDEYIVGIIPIVLGQGRPLFLNGNPTIELHLDDCFIEDGVTVLKYSKR